MDEPTQPPALSGTTWRLAELDGQVIELRDDERAPELVLDLDAMRVSGSGGCNRLMGSFETSGSELRFPEIATTRMACPEPAMLREQAFLRALEATAGYQLDDAGLRLLADDVVVARLEAGEPSTGSG